MKIIRAKKEEDENRVKGKEEKWVSRVFEALFIGSDEVSQSVSADI